MRNTKLVWIAGTPALLVALGVFFQFHFATARAPAAFLESRASEYSIVGPYVYENLTVFLLEKSGAIYGEPYLTLDEAVAAGVLTVTECAGGGQVNTLEVENRGNRAVYLQSGDTVKGGQQDRAIAADTVLPPKSGKLAVPVFCVEPGRWRERNGSGFTAASTPLATLDQRLAAKFYKDQSRVWAAGGNANENLSRQTSGGPRNSFVLASDAAQEGIDAYVNALLSAIQGHDEAIGLAFAINGKINSADVYAGTSLFRKLWPRLLRSCAAEALVKRGTSPGAGVAAEDVRRLMDEAAKGAERDRSSTCGTECRTRLAGKYVRFDTTFGSSPVHGSWVKMD